MRIVIVEDEAITALDISDALKSLGYEVIGTFDNGEEVLKNIHYMKPDLILLDINLEGQMDGIELANGIKKEIDIPFIYITAHPPETFKKRAKLTKPCGYLTKPFSDEILDFTIQKAICKYELAK